MTRAKTPPKMSVRMGCGLITVVAMSGLLLWMLMALVFTILFNIVSPIFNGPTIDYGQGLVVALFLTIVGGLLSK